MQSLRDLARELGQGAAPGHADDDGVRRLWWAGLATLQNDLLAGGEPPRGLWLAAPLPALYEPELVRGLRGWVWAPETIGSLLPSPPLLPVHRAGPSEADRPASLGLCRLPLRDEDGTDPFLLLITPALQVGLAIEGAPGQRRLLARFDAPALSASLQRLDQRLQHDDPAQARELRLALQQLGPLHNDPDRALHFWPHVAERLAAMAPSLTLQPLVQTGSAGRGRGVARRGGSGGGGAASGATPAASASAGAAAARAELALLEALTHEVRTPLATIRTLIRSLLRRGELTATVRQRLEQIDGECSEQIDRFGLIFLAAELQRQPGSGQPLGAHELARTDLSQLLRQLEGLWQRQLARRDLALSLVIEPDLPPVLSDPTRLETMLGGLIDRFGRSLPGGSHVRLSLQAAGSRLKLQLSSSAAAPATRESGPRSTGDPVGPVLSWNPSTGSLQLSRQATQQLFHRLGGRLTERGGSSLTVFFPLDPG